MDMKKLAIILVIILLVIFLLNTVRTVAMEVTMATMVDYFNSQYAKLTSAEINEVAKRLPQKDFTDAGTIVRQFGAFARVITVVDDVLSER